MNFNLFSTLLIFISIVIVIALLFIKISKIIRIVIICIVTCEIIILSYLGNSPWNRHEQLKSLLHNEYNYNIKEIIIESEVKESDGSYQTVISTNSNPEYYLVNIKKQSNPYFWTPTYKVHSIAKEVTFEPPLDTAFQIAFENLSYSKDLTGWGVSYERNQFRIIIEYKVNTSVTTNKAMDMLESLFKEIDSVTGQLSVSDQLKPYLIIMNIIDSKTNSTLLTGTKKMNSLEYIWSIPR